MQQKMTAKGTSWSGPRYFITFKKFTYQNSEIFQKLLLGTSLTQNGFMGYIYFGLYLTLEYTMHTWKRRQCQIQAHCAIFRNWVLKRSEHDWTWLSWFFPLSEVQDHYLCATLINVPYSEIQLRQTICSKNITSKEEKEKVIKCYPVSIPVITKAKARKSRALKCRKFCK